MRYLLLVLFVVLLPMTAFAQTNSVPEVGVMGWIMLVLGALIGFIISPLGKALVKIIPGTFDDDARDWVLNNKATIDKWLDPDDTSKPPTPGGR